jgi:hypothetical protein
MPNHTRTRADLAAWSANKVVTPAEINHLDEKTFNAPNFAGGGLYAPTSPVLIGGSGIALKAHDSTILVPPVIPAAQATNWRAPVTVTTGDRPVTAAAFDPVLGVHVAFWHDGTGDPEAAWTIGGLVWNEITLPTSTNWQPTAATSNGAGRFIVGNTPLTDTAIKIMISDDGDDFTQQTLLDTTGAGVRKLLWFPAASMFIAGLSSGIIETSPTGETGTWTDRASPSPNGWKSGDVSPTLALLAGTDFVTYVTSPNGTSWTSRTPPDTGIQDVVYSRALEIGTGYGWYARDNGVLYRSIDPTTSTWDTGAPLITSPWPAVGATFSTTSPALAAVAGVLMATWSENGLATRHLSYSIDGGANWRKGFYFEEPEVLGSESAIFASSRQVLLTRRHQVHMGFSL